jgi:hypothetical protein
MKVFELRQLLEWDQVSDDMEVVTLSREDNALGDDRAYVAVTGVYPTTSQRGPDGRTLSDNAGEDDANTVKVLVLLGD